MGLLIHKNNITLQRVYLPDNFTIGDKITLPEGTVEIFNVSSCGLFLIEMVDYKYDSEHLVFLNDCVDGCDFVSFFAVISELAKTSLGKELF